MANNPPKIDPKVQALERGLSEFQAKVYTRLGINPIVTRGEAPAALEMKHLLPGERRELARLQRLATSLGAKGLLQRRAAGRQRAFKLSGRTQAPKIRRI